MERSYFQASSWYQAIPLTERIVPLLSQQRISTFDAQLAERRIQNWRSQAPFTTGSYFTERLEIDNLTEEGILYLLGEPVEVLQSRFAMPPVFLEQLRQAFSNCDISTQRSLMFPQSVQLGQEPIGFLYVVEPLICQGLEHLDRGIQALKQVYPCLPFDPSTIESILFANLPSKLIQILYRTLVLELNVARLQGFLQGNTPQERFESFSNRLRQREVSLSLLQEYPVLARQLTLCINQWVNFSLEFLQHLCTDWDVIYKTYNLDNNPDLLVRINGGAGDSHRDGRSVLIAEFNSGFRIVYKPRSLAVEAHFQELLSWLNDRGELRHPFRILKIIDRSTYGWSEFVTSSSCNSVEEVQDFYEQQGSYLALLYALEATDFHYENIIAAGSHPVLVDLETLFTNYEGQGDPEQLNLSIVKTLTHSVLRTGLLPQRIWSNREFDGIDMSGLVAQEGQFYPNRILNWEGMGTDEMKLTHQRVQMEAGVNRPRLNGNEINVLDYTKEISSGFTKLYQLLLQCKDELLSDGGLLDRFAEDEVRVILRPTRTYMLLLRDSVHPDMLRDALERDRLFDNLWLDVRQVPLLKKVISAERNDLWRENVPMFTTRPNSHALWTSTREEIANFFDETGLVRVRRRVQQLSEEDLERQLWFIRASLAALVINKENRVHWSSYNPAELEQTVECGQLQAAARQVGDRLTTLVLHGKKDVSWLSLNLVKENNWSVSLVGADLYDGLAGIALFLGYLGAVCQEDRYTVLSQLTLNTIISNLRIDKSFISSIGGFNGWGGIIYTLTHLGTLWNQPELIAEAESIVDLLPMAIEKDQNLDVISGAAGCIGSLLCLYRCRPSERTLAVAIQCGEHLVSHAQTMTQGKGWVSRVSGKPLTGFSHGAAGIAWALLKLSALTGVESFQQIALDAIAYERSLFSLKAGNWPDLREFENFVRDGDRGQSSYMTAWCHGAPGIGLARLSCLPFVDDDRIRSEIETAANTTLDRGFGLNHSLCHGDLGNLEFLLQVSQTIDDSKWLSHTNRLAAIVLTSIKQHGWLCGVPLGVEVPGLMTGLAGIGYQLLRLAEPNRIPSILMLEPPCNLR
jgi:type 2 lantibiotic biosynthesis protein LanM